MTSARICGVERAWSRGIRDDLQRVKRSKPRAGHGGQSFLKALPANNGRRSLNRINLEWIFRWMICSLPNYMAMGC